MAVGDLFKWLRGTTSSLFKIGKADVNASGLTVPRTLTLPDAAGTVALTSNIPAAITVADTTDATCFVALFESATGDLAPKTDAGLVYDASVGMLVGPAFWGFSAAQNGAGATTCLMTRYTDAAPTGNFIRCKQSSTETNLFLVDIAGNMTAASLSLGTALAIASGGTGQITAGPALDALTVQGADIASASTTNLATATGIRVNITGTTTITAHGTATAGVVRILKFAGALTYTHNATSLILPTAANITTAANDKAILVSLGSGNWECVSYQRASGAALAAGAAVANDIIILEDQKAASTAGGTFTAGAWQTRTLNTEVLDTGNHCALTSNQFKLAAGDYEILASAPGYYCNDHQAKLYNATAAADIKLGTSEWSQTGSVAPQTQSTINHKFTVAADQWLEIRHYCATTSGTYGFGVGLYHSWATVVYTRVFLRKVG